MEAEYSNINLFSGKRIYEAATEFFRSRTPEDAHLYFVKFFQCWTLKDCKIKAEISDEEVALFFDQLMDLVAAAYILHQANRVSLTLQEGNKDE